jgi:hypothetical protein
VQLSAALPAGAVKRQLMGRDFEPCVGQFYRFNFSLVIDHHVENPFTILANEVLVPLHQRIEMLGPADHQDLQLLIGN